MTKKASKDKKVRHTVDSLSRTVRDISASRKKEVENDAEVSQALCGLADYAGALMMGLMNETLKNPNDESRKKDMLLVLHLTYLKLSAEILGEHDIDNGCDIPVSGIRDTKPIDTKKENVPIYI
jgi:hypothetical protein